MKNSGDEPLTSEQAQIVHRLVERVDYDGAQGKLAIVNEHHPRVP